MPTILVLSGLAFVISMTVQPALAQAQQPERIYRVGFLSTSSARSPSGAARIVQKELFAKGYVEGKNIAFEYRYAEDKPERTPVLAEELVRLKVDVIVGGGSGDTEAAKMATKTIPIVFLESVSDPVTLGLVASLAHPGGNVTGFTTVAELVAGKRLELLKEAMPKLSRVGILWSQGRGNEGQWQESQQTAQRLGLQVHSMAVNTADQYETAFKNAAGDHVGAIAATRTRVSNLNRKRIITLAAKYRLPAIYYREDFVEDGGLMSYGADDLEPAKRVAVMVDKILKGAKPADIPVERSTKFEFVVNLKTAHQLNLTIPPAVLARANRVIR